jgi:rhamnogalacturonan endolyase
MGSIFNRLLACSLLLAAAMATRACFADQDSPVVLSDDTDTVTLANGIVSAMVKKSNGNLLSLRLRGVELLSHGGGYWNIYGSPPGQKNTELKPTPSVFRIIQNPMQNGGAGGEIAVLFPYHDQRNTVPLDIAIRYTLHRGNSGVYGWTIADHAPQYPPFDIGVSTVCLKLSPDVFDFLSVDSRRQRPMASAEDWVKGKQLNLWEARRLNTGIRKGEVEHKYDYNVLFSQTPAWGWSSTARHVGLFIVNPSIEYLNGAPVMVDYVGHIDVKPSLPADPTLLFIWHSPHYGGRAIQIRAGEPWRKIVGPFLLYCNAGETPRAMWQDSLKRAAQERKAWPYAWANVPGYEHAQQRGSASGRLVVCDPQAPRATAAEAWVGLAAPPYTATLGRNGPITID